MKITIKEQDGNLLLFLIEREKGLYNNITELIALENTDGLTADEIKTLGFLKLKPLAIQVFEAIEPLDETDNPIGFELIPSRTVKTEIIAPTEVIQNSIAFVTKIITDQYGQAIPSHIYIDTSTIGIIKVEDKTINVISPQPTEINYLLDLDYRLSKKEMGV